MRTSYKLISAIFTVALLAAPAASQQLAKSGTYSAWFGWHSSGTLTDLGKGVMQWHGEFDGALRNDAGSGFMQEASVICPRRHPDYRGARLLSGQLYHHR
jgi:hypothetical protein